MTSLSDSTTVVENPPPADGLHSPSAAAPPPVAPIARSTWEFQDLLLATLLVVLALACLLNVFGRFNHNRNRDRVVADLVQSAAAIQAYMRQNGVGPPTSSAGALPTGLGPFLTEVDWTAPTPVGGHYQLTNHDVQRAGEKTAAAVTINLTSFPPSPTLVLSYADLLEIDRQIDDGNLATGNFRTGFNGWPIFWVRPKS